MIGLTSCANEVPNIKYANFSGRMARCMGDKDGVVAICNYKTGEIISYLSITDNILLSKPDDFYSEKNKFLYGSYIPGSIMKIVTTISAIEYLEEYDRLSYTCKGISEYLDGNVKCQYAHGTQDIYDAFGHSCNCFYGKLSLSIGKEKMLKTVNRLGFNKQQKFMGEKVAYSCFNPEIDDADLAWSGIGQASSRINPSYFLALISTIANNGVCPFKGMTINITERESRELVTFMSNNFIEYYGSNRFPGIKMAGKTGTAEVVGQNSNSLFAGFSMGDEFPYAIICIIENAGQNSRPAIDVASDILCEVFREEGH